MTDFENEYALSDEETTRVMVFPIGKFKSAKYPKLNLTRDKAEAVVRNFKAKVLGETEPFIDSSGKHDESAPAAGWVKDLSIDKYKNGEAVYADVKWNSKGKELIRDEQYRYLSPVLAPHVIPETGKVVGPVLRSMSLTNVPVLRMMPAVTASEDDTIDIRCSELVPAEDGFLAEDGEQWFALEEEQEEVVIEGQEPIIVTTIQTEPEVEASGEEQETDEDLKQSLVTILDRLNQKIRYKRGAPALRAMMREAIAKAKIAASEDEDDVLDPILTALSENAGKEMKNMQKLVEYFKLADDADEDAVLAAMQAKLTEVEASKTDVETKLTETETKLADVETALEAAQTELAEVKKDKRDADIEHRLSEAITAGIIKPADVGDAENPGWLRKLAFSDEALFDEYVEAHKSNPAVDLSEQGSGENDDIKTDEDGLRPDQILAKRARELAESENLSLGEAQVKVLKDDEELAFKYSEYKQSLR